MGRRTLHYPYVQEHVRRVEEGSFGGSLSRMFDYRPSAGLGLEVTRQLLQLNISTVILAVRNISKGEGVVKQLRE